MADITSRNRIWCSKCSVFRDSESFETNRFGRTKKLCNLHGKKRDLEEDDWDTFEAEIYSWNHPDQTHCLDLKRVFNMDSLPVGFASELPVQQDGSTDRSPLNYAINMLAEMIWRKGGFRFWHRRIKKEYLTYVYYCSQDAERVPPSSATGQRDTQRMERFSCRSYLAFKPSLEGRTLEITCDTVIMHHTWTANFSQRDLQAAQPSGWVSATPQQVYYQWQQANSSIWRRDADPLVSAQGLLSEHPGYKSSMYVAANVRGMAFYISDSISALASPTKELAIDATFGTNNMAMTLYAVLAEVDGTGVPLAYCFMDTFKDNSHGVRRAEPGATTAILDQIFTTASTFWIRPDIFWDRQRLL
ncbi:hypothetical protein V1522DRAFT_424705 [Lipomyces starkeyi]